MLLITNTCGSPTGVNSLDLLMGKKTATSWVVLQQHQSNSEMVITHRLEDVSRLHLFCFFRILTVVFMLLSGLVCGLVTSL